MCAARRMAGVDTNKRSMRGRRDSLRLSSDPPGADANVIRLQRDRSLPVAPQRVLEFVGFYPRRRSPRGLSCNAGHVTNADAGFVTQTASFRMRFGEFLEPKPKIHYSSSFVEALNDHMAEEECPMKLRRRPD